MIRRTLIIVSLIFFLYNQSFGGKNHAIGVNGGIVLSNQNWDYDDAYIKRDTEYKVGINLGVFIDIYIKNALILTSEMYLSDKGFKERIGGLAVANNDHGYVETGYKTYYNKFYYLSYILGIKSFLFNNEKLPYLIIGPRIDIYLKSKTEYESSLYNKFRDYVFGISVGCGYKLNLNSVPLLFELKYHPDIDNLYKNEHVTVTQRTFDLIIGFEFNI